MERDGGAVDRSRQRQVPRFGVYAGERRLLLEEHPGQVVGELFFHRLVDDQHVLDADDGDV